MPKVKKLKVVIAAGGDGTRLGDLNPERKPKSLLLFAGKPLISYQLEQILGSFGGVEILLSFTAKSQIDEFIKFQALGLVPKSNYHFDLHSPFDHPHVLFRSNKVISFIKDSDFMLSLGDLVVFEEVFPAISRIYCNCSCTVITREPAREIDLYRMVLKEGVIKKIIKSSKVSWRYGGIYLVTKDCQLEWLGMCSSDKIVTLEFFNNVMCEGKNIFVLDEEQSRCLNLNTPEDYLKVQKYFNNLRQPVLK